jgi:signal transduction histidine kinase
MTEATHMVDALQTNPGLETPRLFADLQHRERQIHAIRRITNALFSHSFVDDMLRETLMVAIEVLEADVGSLQLHDAKTDTLVFRYVLDPQAQHLIGHGYPASQGIGGRVFRSGQAELVNKVHENANFNPAVDDMTGYYTESMLTVPLKRFGGPPIGVMQILNARRVFDERDLEVLEVLSAQAAASIETARLAQDAKKAELVNVLGDVSHDIKNMLTPIQSGIMMLLPELDELFEQLDRIGQQFPGAQEKIAEASSQVRVEYQWILEGALDSAEKVQVRTREIANAVKGEIAPPVFEEADLNETVSSVAHALKNFAKSAQVTLLLELDAALPPAEFDGKQMYNALYNLANNAIPETPPGGSVVLRTRAPLPGETTLLVEVEDTGRGIPENVRANLFTDQAISTKVGGTGLGTRIVAGVVHRHKGVITVNSEEGRGSLFSIQLPLSQKYPPL